MWNSLPHAVGLSYDSAVFDPLLQLICQSNFSCMTPATQFYKPIIYIIAFCCCCVVGWARWHIHRLVITCFGHTKLNQIFRNLSWILQRKLKLLLGLHLAIYNTREVSTRTSKFTAVVILIDFIITVSVVWESTSCGTLSCIPSVITTEEANIIATCWIIPLKRQHSVRQPMLCDSIKRLQGFVMTVRD